MIKFTGLEYLKIDIANLFGMDKFTWQERLDWFEDHQFQLEHIAKYASEFLMYTKAVKAYRDTIQNKPTGHIMYLDSTNSGMQVMAALSGCKQTALATNMIDPNVRMDSYGAVTKSMNGLLNQEDQVTRDDMKYPTMTHYYGKLTQDTLNENQQNAFYNVLSNSFTGAELVKNSITAAWNPNALEHTWELPDGHVAKVKVTEMANVKIEVDELGHTSFSYRYESNESSTRSTSLAPNIIHSIDAYIVREMTRRCNKVGIKLCPIHDAFGSHPNNMNHIRQFYIDIMVEIPQMNLLGDILSQLNSAIKFNKLSDDLHLDIVNSEYMLS